MDRVRSALFALLLIGAGVVLLLQQADVIPKDVSLWPLILMGVGVLWTIERLVWGGGGRGFVLPLVVFAVGLAFFLEDVEAIQDGGVLLPLVVIAIGVGLVLGVLPGRRPRSERAQVPLEGAKRARVELSHGAGRLRVGSHIGGDNLVEGTFAGGVDIRRRREGDRVEARLSANPWRAGFPWGRPGALDWSLTLARTVPMELQVKTGASNAEIDVSDSRVEDLHVETGASKTTVTIPATGEPKVRIHGGATEIRVVVPARMAARILVQGALTEVFVDLHRFHKVDEREYRSPDLEEASHRAEIQIDAGAAKVEVT
jgi:hypothetical protein